MQKLSNILRTSKSSIRVWPTRLISDTGPKNEDGTKKPEKDTSDSEIPPPPNTCCMSGCANCVWIEYAEILSQKLNGGTKAAKQIIMNEVQDVNMRAFLEMELRNMERKENSD